jgi:hypothetical protein
MYIFSFFLIVKGSEVPDIFQELNYKRNFLIMLGFSSFVECFEACLLLHKVLIVVIS